ncbi:MAG: type 1 glutamine amidotransferase [Nocardioidaceae bacterium]|nr:type 1 glutamine amidotransferase [Nocardioidaceae bacterium]MCL2614218.1 type 1 glutamine amidotransferase [Nocardioidaceae bacterium]
MTEAKIAFLVANEGIERVELTTPWDAVEDAGHTAVLLSPKGGEAKLFDHLDAAETRDSTALGEGGSVEDYDALVLPGGVANPDSLRTDPDAVAFTAAFMASGKPVAAICHAPWMLVEADVVDGRRLTSWPSLKTDIRNAGGDWQDERCIVDGNLITSRNPDDLPAFTSALLEAINHGTDSAESAAG